MALDDEKEDAGKRKERLAQLANAEERYRALLQRRDAYNAEARGYADDRNNLNNERRRILDEIAQLKVERDALNAEARMFRDQRNELQKLGKSKVGDKTHRGKGVVKDLNTRVRELETEIKIQEMRYETGNMPAADERKHLDKVRQMHAELKDLKALAADQNLLKGDIKGLNVEIDALFAKANEFHNAMVDRQSSAQEKHEQIVKLSTQVNYLRQEGERKHSDFVKTREKANEIHNKSLELRETILVLKKENQAERDEVRKLISDQNKKVKQELFSDEKMDEFTDSAIELLKNQGKFTL